MRPTLLRLGALQVRSYGVMLVLAFASGTLWAMREARRRGLAPERMLDAGLAALVGGLVGGRALYVILDPYTTWRDFPLVWHGGLSFHGGLIGGIIAVAIYALLSRTGLALILDSGAPAMALGYAVGRIGCFLNGCCYGAPTRLPWGVRFLSPASGQPTPPSHPAQLYASAGSLIVFALLLALRRRARGGGQLFIAYLGLYGVMRFIIELWRRGYTAELLWGPLTQAQVASIGMAVLALVGWFILGRRGKRD